MFSSLVAGVHADLAVAAPVGTVGTSILGLSAWERFSVSSSRALGLATDDGG